MQVSFKFLRLKQYIILWKHSKLFRYSLILVTLFSIKYIYNIFHRKINKYPNCTTLNLPFIGCILQFIYKGPHKFQSDLIEDDVSMCYIFNHPIIYINDLKLLENTFRDLTTIDPQYKFENMIDAEFSLQNGNEWKYRRNLIHQSFSLMLQSNYMDKTIPILMEQSLYKTFDKYSNNKQSFKIRSNIKWFGFSLLFTSIFGNKYIQIPSQNDAKYIEYEYLVHRIFAKMIIAYSIHILPSLLFPECFKIKLQKYFKITQDIEESVNIISFWAKQYEIGVNHKLVESENDDCCFNKMLKYIEENKITFNKSCSDINALFLAGTHVTLAIMETAIYYVCKYQNIQQRVYNELKTFYNDNNFDLNYHLELKHFNQLHIFRAFTYELMRYNGVVPSTLPRSIKVNNFKIGTYNIPKGATILGNLWSIHKNKKYWKYPNKFYIEHFLDKNNNFKRNNAFILFGYGKRNCVGQSVAIKELYSVLAAIFIRYKFKFHSSINNEDIVIPQDWLTHKTAEIPLFIEKR